MVAALAGERRYAADDPIAGRRLPVPVHTRPIVHATGPADDPSFSSIMALFHHPAFAGGLPVDRMRPSENVERLIPEIDYRRSLGEMSPTEIDAHQANRAEEIRRLKEAMGYAIHPMPWAGPPANSGPGTLPDQAGLNDIGRFPVLRGAMR